MSALRRIVLLRHGNTVGNSHERYHGRADVALSDEGRAQVREAGRALAYEVFETVAASPMARAWESAKLLCGAHPVLLVPEFAEVDFGRWEGLSAAEIEARDPALYRAWQERAADFEYPGGERRSVFRARVLRGLEALERTGAQGALVVTHKGVIRILVEHLSGEPLEDGAPELGGSVSLTRVGERWIRGKRPSSPEAGEGIVQVPPAA